MFDSFGSREISENLDLVCKYFLLASSIASVESMINISHQRHPEECKLSHFLRVVISATTHLDKAGYGSVDNI